MPDDDLDVYGYTRDNKCGDCGVALGQVHRSGCKTGRLIADAVKQSAEKRNQPVPDLSSISQGDLADRIAAGEYLMSVHRAEQAREAEHQPSDHGHEFWTSGCTDPACVSAREEARQRGTEIQANVYLAVCMERDQIYRRLHALMAEWDWDAWHDGEWNEEAAQWAEKAVREMYSIVGLEVPKP